MGPFHRLESNRTNLSLDLEWFLFLLVKYTTLITKQARVLQENGAVSLVGNHSDQFKFGIRMVFSFVKYIAVKKKIMIFLGPLYLLGRCTAVVFVPS